LSEAVQAAITVNVMTAWAHLLIQASIALIAWAWLAFKRPKLFIWAFPCIAVFCAFLSYAYYLAYCTGARDSLFAQDSVYYVYLFVQPMLIAGLFILLHSFLFPIPVDHRMGSEIGFGFFFYFLIFMLRGQPQWSMSAIGIDTLDEIKSLSSIRLYLIDWFWTYAITGVLLVVLFFLFRRWPEFRTQAKRDATVTIIGTMAAAAVLMVTGLCHPG